MSLVELMKENDIELDWLFTLAKLNSNEGLMYFAPVVETINDAEVTNLEPKCFIIDGALFVYGDELDDKIEVNSINNVISLTRVDGIQLNIDTKTISGFPFKHTQFKSIPFTLKSDVKDDYVEYNDVFVENQQNKEF
jgi:hypothetical protein